MLWSCCVPGKAVFPVAPVLCLFAHSCLTLCDPMDYSLPGFSVHEILQARTLEWVAISFTRNGTKVKRESEVAQSCPTLSDPMDCNLPGSSTHGIFQARVLEWGATAFSAIWCYADQSGSHSPHVAIRLVAAIPDNVGFPGGAVVKNPAADAEDARDASSIPGSGRSPGEGNGNPLQFSCLGNPMDRQA